MMRELADNILDIAQNSISAGASLTEVHIRVSHADDQITFIFKDDGELYQYRIGSNSMTFVRSQRIIEGADAWGPMAYADGRLIVRDAHNVVCLKIK